MSARSLAAFPYEEPAITTVLNLAGFLLALNVTNVCLDKLLYCGLIGQLFIGILWGSPGAKWLGPELEHVIQQLGYLGLIMLVYEGGLSISIKALKANISVSITVALTGIVTPIALSFVLRELSSATYLQAFAAGAALSSTSLGTTFTILSTTNLITSRLGTVTSCAAMLDDVVGLVMVQVIANLQVGGGANTSLDPITILRPILVSIGFAVGIWLLCSFCLPSILGYVMGSCWDKMMLPKIMRTSQFAFLVHTLILVGMVAGASYAGTSSLFAAYLSGVLVKWFDEYSSEDLNGHGERAAVEAVSKENRGSQEQASRPRGAQVVEQNQLNTTDSAGAADHEEVTALCKGEYVYEKYFKAPVGRILIPFFFASIGFAIPISKMFRGSIVWRGIVYAVLMVLGKAVTGIWLLRFTTNPVMAFITISRKSISCITRMCTNHHARTKKRKPKPHARTGNESKSSNQISHTSASEETRHSQSTAVSAAAEESTTVVFKSHLHFPPKPKSLYPPVILGLAMIARGEIGYLIASLAQSKGIFSNGTEDTFSDIYLVVIWAITVCTLIGPIAVGTLARRVKNLQRIRANSGGQDPLGVWGI